MITPHPLPRVPMKRRALVGLAWTLAWTLVWASALLMFATKTRAETLLPAVSGGAVSPPVYVPAAHGFIKDKATRGA